MTRQRRRKAARIMFKLMDERIGSSSGTWPMNEDHLSHMRLLDLFSRQPRLFV